MRRGNAVSLAVVVWCLAAAVLIAPGVSSARDPAVFRHPVYGGVDTTFGDCPDIDGPAPAGTVCIDNYLIVFRGYGVFTGPIAPPKAPLSAYAETVRLEFTEAEEPNVTLLRHGFTETSIELSVDLQHLTTASVSVAIPMDDGSTFDFTGRWTPTTERFVSGSNGPATGAPHLVVDRCHTSVALGHQKYREAWMVGTLDGAPVQSYTAWWSGSIFNNSFRYIDIPHGGSICG